MFVFFLLSIMESSIFFAVQTHCWNIVDTAEDKPDVRNENKKIRYQFIIQAKLLKRSETY